MAYALSTQGQGTAPYIAFPDWRFGTTAGSTGVSAVEIEFEIIAFNGRNATLLNASNSTQNLLRVYPDGRISYRTSATDRIITDVGAVVVGQKYKARLEYNKSITTTYFYLDNVLVGEYVASNTTNFNQINRFSTNTTSSVDMILYSLSMINDSNYSTYSDSFPVENATGTGTEWVSSEGTRSLVVTNFTGAADSWWISYGGTGGSLDIALSTIGSTVAFSNATVTKDKLVNLSTIGSTVSLGSPTVTKDKLVNLSNIGSTVSLGSPKVTKDKLITLPVISTGTLVNSPNVTKEKRISLALINSTASVRIPSVGVQGSKSIGLSRIEATTVILTPKILKDKLIQLQHKYNTSVVQEPEVKRDKLIVLGIIETMEQMYAPEILGGYRPLPNITLFPAEGYGLHIRSAEDLLTVVVALAKRLEVLEKKDIP